MSQIIQGPWVRKAIPPAMLREELKNIEASCVLNGHALGAWAHEFEIECRRAVGRLGEAAALAILQDVIKSVQQEWR